MKPFYERYEEFSGIEIQNVSIIVDLDTSQISYEAGLKNADMYGVYMILNEGTVEHVGDFPTRATAKYMAILIRDRFRELQRNRPFELIDKSFEVVHENN